jgi:GAF domain-containing protein
MTATFPVVSQEVNQLQSRNDLSEHERALTIEFLRLVNESRGTKQLVRAATGYFQRISGCSAVGIRLREGPDYPYFETHGFPQEFVDSEMHLCSRDELEKPVLDEWGHPVLECMCGNVIVGRFDPQQPFFSPRGSFWSNCTTRLLATSTEADRQARTRNRCNGEGYESVALVALRTGGETLGLLQINDEHEDQFSADLIAFWEHLADQLAIELRKSEQRYRTLVENLEDVSVCH